jgi:glycosyltransferase involved in cell wall biosynthesis
MTGDPLRIAHVMSRFPKVSETFVLTEILELERRGVGVEVFPLVLERGGTAHPEAAPLVARAHDLSPRGGAPWAAAAATLARSPRRYSATCLRGLAGNARSPRFLVRAMAVLPAAALIARRAQGLGIGHVHAHFATHPALAAWAASRLTGLPFSFTIHAHDLYVDRTMLATKLAEARFVVTISDFNRRLIGKLYGGGALAKTHVVRCGIDLGLFRPPPAPRAEGSLRIVCVASLDEYKGQRYLVEACARLREAGRDVTCTLVGEGDRRPDLRRLVSVMGLHEVVRFAGARPRNEVKSILAGADVVAQPSVVTRTGKMEGLPVVLMEALAMERPVVATGISGIPELVEDGVTGLLVPQGDAAALAAAIAGLADDPALGARLAAAGRWRVRERHDQRRNVAALHDLLSASVTAGPRSQGRGRRRPPAGRRPSRSSHQATRAEPRASAGS